MGVISQIEQYKVSPTVVLYSAPPIGVQNDLSFARRSGTYTVRAVDGGRDPYGNLPAPLDIRHFPSTWMVIPPGPVGHGNYDQSRDALLGAVGHGFPVTLVYLTDGGTERIARAKFMGISDVVTPQSPFAHTFTVTWEIADWTDRDSRSTNSIGVGSPVMGSAPTLIMGGIVYPLTDGSGQNFIAIYTDGSDGKPKTTKPDRRCIITVKGPFGSDLVANGVGGYALGGFTVFNTTAHIVDSAGNLSSVGFTVYRKLGSGDTVVVDAGRKRATINGQLLAFGTDFVIPDWQVEWFRIEQGAANSILFSVNGPSFSTGGQALVDFIGRYH